MSKRIFLLILLLFATASLLPAKAKQDNDTSSERGEMQQVAGTVERILQGSVVLRVGDATQTFSFNNKTVFTYGDRTASASDLKPGEDVLVTSLKDEAVKVNGTEQIEGIIEQIDEKGGKLVVKVGDKTREIPLHYFQIFTSDWKKAALQDMKIGDSVMVNLNLGFTNKTRSKQ